MVAEITRMSIAINNHISTLVIFYVRSERIAHVSFQVLR